MAHRARRMWHRGPPRHGESDSDSESQSRSVSRASSSRSPMVPNGNGHQAPTAPSIKSSLSDLPPVSSHWIAKRHITCGNPTPSPGGPAPNSWRNKSQIKCLHGALVICLNPVVDPPEVYKTDPCAVKEAWVDPRKLTVRKASEMIGQNLQKHFEALNARMKFKAYADPSYDDVEKACTALRRLAKGDRTLFYYNGHGVPKPTPSGELWVFNKDYSQYIPVSIIHLQSWLASPTIYVWDATAAGSLLTNFLLSAERRDENLRQRYGQHLENAPSGLRPYSECIQMASCLADETLPMCPELPADLFTSCLTSPIDTAVLYFILTQQLPSSPSLDLDIVGKIPGETKDRRTPLGELNWILTAVTDTIAWTTFPRHLFQKLYRSDLMIAALFRNFLLAERIMKNYKCTPHTSPPLPSANTHPLWGAWDMALDGCLKQIANYLDAQKAAGTEGGDGTQPIAWDYKPSEFFVHHLKAFSIWVGGHGTAGGMAYTLPRNLSSSSLVAVEQRKRKAHRMSNASTESLKALMVGSGVRRTPDELPIILQVLLSNTYRVQALFLICQFMDLGPWAVHLSLLIGIFPYVHRLLQAPTQELRAPLIFIWARMIAVDESCRTELLAGQGWAYFANVLAIDTQRERERENERKKGKEGILPNPTEHRAMCLFVLSEVARSSRTAQNALSFPQPVGPTQQGQPPPQAPISVFRIAYETLEESDYLLKQWAALCLAQLWADNDEVKVRAVEWNAPEMLVGMLGSDRSPEVRAACLYAIGTLFGAAASDTDEGSGIGKRSGGYGSLLSDLDEFSLLRMEITIITGCTLTAKGDMSPMVRKELVTVLSCAVCEYRGWFIIAAWVYWEEEHDLEGRKTQGRGLGQEKTRTALYEWFESQADDEELTALNRLIFSSIFTIFAVLLDFTLDPYPEVSAAAQTVVDWIMACLIESPFARLPGSTLDLRTRETGGTSGSSFFMPTTSNFSKSTATTPRSRVVSLQSDKGAPTSTSTASPSIPKRAPLVRSNTGISTSSRVGSTLKRTGSAIMNYAFPSMEDALYSYSQPIAPNTSRSSQFTTNSDAPAPPHPHLNLFQYQPPYDASASPLDEGNGLSDANLEFGPTECIEALIDDDWERIRGRRHRRLARSPPLNGAGSPASPEEYGLESPQGDLEQSRSGLGTGSSLRDILPFRSRFYEWSREYFIEPQMRQAESDEPGSVEYNKQIWRKQRNDRIQFETRAQAAVAGDRKWDRKVGTWAHAVPGSVMHSAFHAFDSHLLVCNEHQTISVWDWARQEKLQTFVNGNPTGTSITSLRWINEDIGGLVMAASSDGIIKLYRNHESETEDRPLELVTGFRAIPTLMEVERGAGIVTAWSQIDGSLYIGGDSYQIALWNAHTELSEQMINTGSDSMITSIALGTSHTFVASAGDGSLRVYDRRVNKNSPLVATFNGHSCWVQSVRWQAFGSGAIMSASVDGTVKLWDLRGTGSCVHSWSTQGAGLSAFDIHDQTSVFATSSAVSAREYRSQSTIVQSLKLEPSILGRINVSTGLGHAPYRPPSAFHAATSSLSFHPTEMLLAIGAIDGKVRIAGCNLGDWRAPEPEDELDGFPFQDYMIEGKTSDRSY